MSACRGPLSYLPPSCKHGCSIRLARYCPSWSLASGGPPDPAFAGSNWSASIQEKLHRGSALVRIQGGAECLLCGSSSLPSPERNRKAVYPPKNRMKGEKNVSSFWHLFTAWNTCHCCLNDVGLL